MLSRENAVDASFYNLIHQVISSGRGVDFPSRRSEERRPFTSTQRIAVRRGPGLPDESQFVPVECHDLTRKGFSFLLPNEPDFDTLVAAFGAPPEAIYVSARVARCSDVLLDSSGNIAYAKSGPVEFASEDFRGRSATPMVMVGCEFIERLKR